MNKLSVSLRHLRGRNAFEILSTFIHEAEKEGWCIADIEKITDEAQEGDYENLMKVIFSHCD